MDYSVAFVSFMLGTTLGWIACALCNWWAFERKGREQEELLGMPEHLRKKSEALSYELLAKCTEKDAKKDPRLADLAQYYREEFNKLKHWLDGDKASPTETDPLSSALTQHEPRDLCR